MKKVWKRINNIIWAIIIGLLALYIAGMVYFPQKTTDLVGYRFYEVLTDSMEPVIPTHSFVLVKMARPGQTIRPGTIVTFHVDYLGEDRIYTHYLKKIERDETGKYRYYTQGATAPDYDSFHTYREDIVGTYVFHIPSLGKIILFIRSPFALIELAILVIIQVAHLIFWRIFDTEEHLDQTELGTGEALKLKNVDTKNKKGNLNMFGDLYNNSKESIKDFSICISFLARDHSVLDTFSAEVEEIKPKKKFRWSFATSHAKETKDYKIVLYKQQKESGEKPLEKADSDQKSGGIIEGKDV